MISFYLIVFNLPDTEGCLAKRANRAPDPPTCNVQMIRFVSYSIDVFFLVNQFT